MTENVNDERLSLISKAIAPDLITKIEVIKSGFNSDAIIVNDEWLFRFPKKQEVCEEYIREKSILELVEKQVDIEVPKLVVYQDKEMVFTKHRLISGEQYTFAKDKMSEAQKDVLAFDLATFLVQLHHIKSELKLKQYSLDEFPSLKEAKVLPEAYDLEIRQTLVMFYEKTKSLKSENAVLCHTDLNENNLLIKNGKLCGVIDFGGVNICERSLDFAALTKFDYMLAKKMAEYYVKISGKFIDFEYAILIEKMICYNGIIANLDKPESLARYRRWLSKIDAGQGINE